MDDAIDMLLDVARRLDSAAIPYMVGGSMAANMYAEPRFTNDVDVVIRISEKNKAILIPLFESDYYITPEAVSDAFAGLGILNIIHNRLTIKCDLILLKSDPFSQTSFLRQRREKLRESAVNVMSPEDLILQKLLWRKETGSPLQLGDVQRIIALNRESLDVGYCRHWAEILGLEPDLRVLL